MRTSFFRQARGLLLLTAALGACAEGTALTFGDGGSDTTGGSGGSGAAGAAGPGSGAAGPGPGPGSGASGPGAGGQGGQGAGPGAGGNGGTAGEGGTGATTTTAMSDCGDSVCNPAIGETCTSCVADCGVCCGDGNCDAGVGETTASCPADCTGGTTSSGTGACNHDSCTSGDPLDPSCSLGAQVACELYMDTYCCTVEWDQFCADVYGVLANCQ